MPARLIRDGELGQVMSNHVGLHLDLIEGLSIVYTDNAANHFRDDDHVAEMGADRLGLFAGTLSSLLGFAELLDQCHALAVESTLESVIYLLNVDKC